MGRAGRRDLTGMRLGPYQLEAALGDGSFGRRYRARHLALDSSRVIEVRDADPAFQEAARAVARQEHPDAATVLDFGAEGELEYLVIDRAMAVAPADRPVARPASRPPRPVGPRLAVAVAAALVGAGVLTAVVRVTPPVPDRAAATPPTALGQPLRVAGLTLTVLSDDTDATPPAGQRLDAGERFVTVFVQCRNGGRAPESLSPYDWVVSDAGGDVSGAVVDGVDGPLPQRMLRAGQSARGRIGFVVPRTSRGLELHFDSEQGYESAQLPLS